jgi:hypothetical protein
LLKDASRPAEDRCKKYEEATVGFITELGSVASGK